MNFNPFSGGGLGDLMKQAAKMREDFERIQADAAKRTVEASSGGGMVKVVANGKGQVISLALDPEMLKLNDPKMMQDLIVAAVNQAISEAQKMMAEEMGKLTGGLGSIASLFKGLAT